MERYLKIITFLVLCVGFGCEDLYCRRRLNGNCRLAEVQCDDDLICREGKCVLPLGNDLPTLDIALELLKRELIADGEDLSSFNYW